MVISVYVSLHYWMSLNRWTLSHPFYSKHCFVFISLAHPLFTFPEQKSPVLSALFRVRFFSCVWWLSPCFEGADCSRRSTWHKVQLEEKTEQEQRGHIRAQSLFCRRLGKRSRIWTQFCPTESRKKKSRWDGEQSPRGATRGILTYIVVSSALAGNTVKLTQMISVMQNFSSSTDQGLKGKYEYHLNNERA